MCRDIDDACEAEKKAALRHHQNNHRYSLNLNDKDKNGKVLTEDKDVKDRWKESSKDLLNRERALATDLHRLKDSNHPRRR